MIEVEIDWLWAALPAALTFLLTLAGTPAVLRYLRRSRILDRPNERSSHKLPTPRGGGLAVAPAVLVGWAVASSVPGPLAGWGWVAIAGTILLMITSWADDRHTLPALPRLFAHAGVVAGALVMLPGHALVFQGWLPFWADRMVAGIGWLWFVNLYNFMDGIDGITGVETASIGIGIALVAALAGAATGTVPLALACAAAGLAFLVWNWHPARIFLGDVGSIPLGFLLGGLLIHLALAGQLAAALILPAYYLADATITITKRALRGERIWQAHRTHFYQRAVQGGRSHAQVAAAIIAANLALMACALVAAAGRPWEGLAASIGVTALLLLLLQLWSRRKPA